MHIDVQRKAALLYTSYYIFCVKTAPKFCQFLPFFPDCLRHAEQKKVFHCYLADGIFADEDSDFDPDTEDSRSAASKTLQHVKFGICGANSLEVIGDGIMRPTSRAAD